MPIKFNEVETALDVWRETNSRLQFLINEEKMHRDQYVEARDKYDLEYGFTRDNSPFRD